MSRFSHIKDAQPLQSSGQIGKQILQAISAVSNEKSLPKNTVFLAVMEALSVIIAKRLCLDPACVEVDVDHDHHQLIVRRKWMVVERSEDIQDLEYQIDREEASFLQKKYHITQSSDTDMLYVPIDYEFTRIDAHAAKQVILQKVKEAECSAIFETMIEKKGKIISGIVKRVLKDGVLLDFGSRVESPLRRDDMLPKEYYRLGDVVKVLLLDIRLGPRPSLVLTRTHPQLLIELLKQEVPEIQEGLIEIMDVARDPGSHSKIAVRTKDKRLDPVGTCVGARGLRAQRVSNELLGERVDIILWDQDPAQFVINAMAPAEILSIVVDEDRRSMLVAVEEDTMPRAIGRHGQNVKLASELTGWNIIVLTETQLAEKNQTETEALMYFFTKVVGFSDEISEFFIEHGFRSVEEIMEIGIENLNLSPSNVNEIRNKIEDYEQNMMKKLSSDLMKMLDFNKKLMHLCVDHQILDIESLAEQSIDDMLDLIHGQYDDRQTICNLIMKARCIAWNIPHQEDGTL